MPRRVDYAARFAFLRQAAFELVRDEGVEALTRRGLAAELGTGLNTVLRLVNSKVDLVRLAAHEVVTRRRRGRFNRRSDDPAQLVANLVRALMPEDESHLDEELVWLRLVAACSLTPTGLEPRGSARREFWVAQRGYDDGLPVDPRPLREPAPEHEDRHTAMQPYLDTHLDEMASMVARMLELVGAPTPYEDAGTLVTAVIEGLTWAACLGRITPEKATDLAIAYVTGLGARRDQAA
jgi:AcrR family transcriptional regulator